MPNETSSTVAITNDVTMAPMTKVQPTTRTTTVETAARRLKILSATAEATTITSQGSPPEDSPNYSERTIGMMTAMYIAMQIHLYTVKADHTLYYAKFRKLFLQC